jgi:Ca2+-transporting ATPase
MNEIKNESQERNYSISIENLLEKFHTTKKKGLSTYQVKKKLDIYGYNEFPEAEKAFWRIYLAPLFNFLILILIITGITLIILGSASETFVTWIVVIINSSAAIIQQYRAQKALDSLKKISALSSIVIREGKEIEIPSREIVPGDIVLLSQGDKVPADARIIDSADLSVNEAPLTGESIPVEKHKRRLEVRDLPIQKQDNMVFMGTYIHTGKAKILIVKTADNTEIGKISQSLNKMGSIEDIPLTKKLNHLAYLFGALILINMSVLIIYKLLFLNQSITTAFTDSIIRALNILPINLPLLVTLVLITGVLDMAKSGVIIKNLSAIESLGRISVICSDKTGTLTKNEMTVKKMWINGKDFDITGSGYDSNGKIIDTKVKETLNSPSFSLFIDSMVLNNNAKLVFEDIKIRTNEIKTKIVRKVRGSPTEGALLVLAEKAGYIIYDIKRKYIIQKEFSFDSTLKRMTTICKSNDNEQRLYAFSKGAPEIILDFSTHIEINGQKTVLKDGLKNNLRKNIQEHANQGYRTLAIAYRELTSIKNVNRDLIEKKLTFLGFVSIIDPARIGVKEAIEECQSAGIKVTMITGDHPITAKTIATNLNIFTDDEGIVEGREIKSLTPQQFQNISVFARVAPSDKELIVQKNQDNGKVVAMTGDGVNDSLALKHANCGVAMGITGTDLAKDTADMVISDDNFTSIKKGIEIGRGLFSKIRTIIFFFICIDIMEGFIFLGLEFFPSIELFSSNWQQIYIYAVVHSLPPLALVLDTLPKGIMKEPPRDEEEILNHNMWKLLSVGVIFIGIILLTILFITLGGLIPLNIWNTDPTLSYIDSFASVDSLTSQKARSMFVTTLFLAEVSLVWCVRRPNEPVIKSIKKEFSPILFIVSLVTVLLHALFILCSRSFNELINDILRFNLQLNFMFLSLTDWLICMGFASIGIIPMEIYKKFIRNKKKHF